MLHRYFNWSVGNANRLLSSVLLLLSSHFAIRAFSNVSEGGIMSFKYLMHHSSTWILPRARLFFFFSFLILKFFE